MSAEGTDAGRVALIAGQGALAPALAARLDAPVICALEGFDPDPTLRVDLRFRLERLVPFLDALHEQGVTRVAFGGAIRRPALEPELFDPRTATLVPRIVMAMGQGDDAALREVIAIFEEWDLPVIGTAEIAPDLIPGAGVLCGAPDDRARQDAAQAAALLAATGALDIGQGAVLRKGLCVALETLPGTQAMLEFCALHRGEGPASGVFYKAPKPTQDMRIDMPAIGPDTIDQAAQAGLAGIAWQAGGVLMLDRAACVARAQAQGLFLWARDPGEGAA